MGERIRYWPVYKLTMSCEFIGRKPFCFLDRIFEIVKRRQDFSLKTPVSNRENCLLLGGGGRIKPYVVTPKFADKVCKNGRKEKYLISLVLFITEGHMFETLLHSCT